MSSPETITAQDGGADQWVTYLDRALEAGASDLHMTVPADEPARIRARVDGVLVSWGSLEPKQARATLTRLQAAASLGTGSAPLIGEGRIRHEGPRGPVYLRLTVTPLVSSTKKVTIRLPVSSAPPRLAALGLSAENYGRYERMLARPSGLLLATGPVGSGKTTTLMASLRHLASPGAAVVTVEDPVEHILPGADQIEVNDASGLTYAHILRSLLRMDLDALLIGETRDQETAEHAVKIAKAGRLVMSTLHAADAVGAVLRLQEMAGLGPRSTAESVTGVICQRLLRQVHASCAGEGCTGCLMTGYRGRVPVHEVLEVNDEFRDAWINGATHRELTTVAKAAGLRTVSEDAQRWLNSGHTTSEEVERVIGRA